LIVQETINNNIVPILYTFPLRPEFPEKTVLFNQILVNIAQDYDIPLINLYMALAELPDQGIDVVNPTHVSLPADGQAGMLTAEGLQSGATLRNLLTLQTLANFQAALHEDDAEATETPSTGG
jgi:hypothetical protein